MARFSVILDACVLYPAVVRDAVMRLALTDLFKARWSDDIHNEWITALLRETKEDGSQRYKEDILYRTRDLMDKGVRDAKVSGYEYLIPSIELPDPDDRHVVAAAIHAKADAIVTYNLKDFPQDYLAENFDIEIIHPDDFFRSQFDLNTGLAVKAFQNQFSSLKKPPLTSEEFITRLQKVQLIQTASFLKDFI
jgi:predicted nucleic acid-binding protein